MKTYKKSIVILTFIIFIALIFPINVKSVNDIDFTVNKEVLYNKNSNTFDFYNNDTFNMDNNITSFTQTYNSTYSFTNETDGTSGTDINFIDFIDVQDIDTEIQINGSYFGHDKVIEIIDGNGAGSIIPIHQFDTPQAFGFFEFWWLISSVGTIFHIRFRDSINNTVFRLGIQTNNIELYDGSWNTLQSVSNNKWIHVLIYFECTAGNFNGLNQYETQAYINGINEGVFGMENNRPNINQFYFQSIIASINNNYFDGFGFYSDSYYNEGYNLIPLIEVDTSIKQISAYEFVFENRADKYDFGSDNPETWTDVENGGDDVNVELDYNNWHNPFGSQEHQSVDRVVEISGTNQLLGLYKDGLTLSGIFLNITFTLNFTLFDTGVSTSFIELYSSDTTKILDLRIGNVAGIRLVNNNPNADLQPEGTNLELYTGMNINDIYTFNVFLNYEIDRAFLLMYENNIIIGYWHFSLLTLNKQGLDKIYFKQISAVGKSMTQNIDYCGIYVNGKSKIETDASYGYISNHFEGNSWTFNEHNLFTLNASGMILTYKTVNPNFYRPHFHGGASYLVEGFTSYTNNSKLSNIIHNTDGINPFDWALVVFYFKDTFIINSVNIEGVSLTESTNKYWLELSYSGVDINESYFYADNNNKLQFSLTTNDTDTEYIQATFNISDVSSTDRAISFRGYRLNKAYGYFVVNYSIGISTIDIPIIEKTTRTIIPTNKTIESLIVLITDNDQDIILGTTTGYISRPRLIAITAIGLPIITAGLLEMMIPLLMILIPTLLISKGFGKEGKKLIIPLFLMFSLIITATLIIPVWIFFIIIFGTGLFLARNKEIEGN